MTNLWQSIIVLAVLCLGVVIFSCEDSVRPLGQGGGDADADTDTDSDSDADADGDVNICGDGLLGSQEACDDANTNSNDGCTGDCLYVEEGWSCVPPGMPCHRMVKCGDGQWALPEMCDDGDTTGGDGCSATCKVEIGYKCSGSPSVCVPTVCGDGLKEGAETCDDQNAKPFDGCNAECQSEPSCPLGQPCSSSCGDGMVLGAEQCDDGNGIDGDGCTSQCTVEFGFTCNQAVELGESMTVPIILRDFTESHEDFEFPGDQEGDIAWGLESETSGLVQPTLSSEKKPLFTGTAATTDPRLIENGLIHSPESFDTWYQDPEDPDATVVSELILFDDDGDGSFVNRYTLSGGMWERLGVEYEGNPVFFPMDDLGITPESDYEVARIPPNYFGMPEGTPVSDADSLCSLDNGCNPCWPIECITGDSWNDGDCVDSNAGQTVEDYRCYSSSPRHNFHFTTQVVYWFQYNASNTYTLSFVGDDDLWVFVNGQLVMDLGGIHVAIEDEVVLNTFPGLNLADGNVYEIMVFHAERQTYASTYKLTLSGFNTSRSECLPTCGDGILVAGEECDDGVNDGGYGECAPGCVLGEYCGDGILQEAYGEHCDDGNFRNGDECPSSCRLITVV